MLQAEIPRLKETPWQPDRVLPVLVIILVQKPELGLGLGMAQTLAVEVLVL
jgi:hypothetical protein